MPRLPVVSGALFGRILTRPFDASYSSRLASLHFDTFLLSASLRTPLGWTFRRQKGSHRIFLHPTNETEISVPMHEEMAEGTLWSLISQAGLTREQFIEIHRHEK